MGVMSQTQEHVLTVTENAARRARTVAEREGRADAALRVRVVAGGCDGFSYELSFDDATTEDHVIEVDGFRVLVDPRSAPILAGSTLEFNDSLVGGGLKVFNPQATHECACGKSFSI
jgi:iron-sulfur cluster assembly accessory protein